MKVPKDHGLVLTIFFSISIFAVLALWATLPPTISFEENDEIRKVLPPEEAVLTAEEILLQAESTLADLEKKNEAEEDKGKESKSGAKK